MAMETADQKMPPTGREGPDATTAQDRAAPTATAEGRQATEQPGEAAHEGVDRTAGRSAPIEEQLRETGEQAAEHMQAAREAGSQQAQELYEQVAAYVREHPLASIGIAAAAGFVIGSLGGRR